MKKNLWNAVMVVAIVAIIISGIMIVGSVQGTVGGSIMPPSASTVAVQGGTTPPTAQDKLGSVNIERSGIAYSLTAGSTLRDGDIIETLGGSEITLTVGTNSIRLGQNSEVAMLLSTDGISTVMLNRGEVFASADSALHLSLMGSELVTDGGVFVASAYTGSGSVYLLDGTANVDGQPVASGEAMSILEAGIDKNSLAIESLNDFAIANVRKAGTGRSLYFSTEQLDKLTEQREAEMRLTVQESQLAQQQQISAEQSIEQQRRERKNALAAASSAAASAASSQAAAEAADNDRYSDSDEDEYEDEDSNGKLSCSIEIRCDSILDNMENLVEGKDQYVPSSGKLLSRRTVPFSEGDTAFDVLKRVCRQEDIQLEYSHSPVYDSYYIEGINNLYEFDCGGQSGWMYKINGWFPNYGSSTYNLQDGDVMVWGYVCEGYESGF